MEKVASIGEIKDDARFFRLLAGFLSFKPTKGMITTLRKLGKRDETAEIVYGNGAPVPDSELRDYEYIPILQNIEDYFIEEVLPYVADAWMDRAKDKVGYEINFTKCFKEYHPLRSSRIIAKELINVEESHSIINVDSIQKRLSPDLETNDYDMQFVGKIPAHWKKYRLRFLLKDGYDGLKIGPFGSQLKIDEMVSDGYKVYGQENVIASDFRKGNRFISSKKFGELKVYEIKPGDILITMMGSSGRCEIVEKNIQPGIMDSHLVRLRVREELITSQFLKYLVHHVNYVKYQIEILGKGSIMHGLNSSIIKSLVIFLPSIQEQRSIESLMSHEAALIDHYIDATKNKILLAEKLRTALFSEVFTGKIDARGFEPEMLDNLK